MYENAALFGGDPTRLYISGHSFGAHLAGTVLKTDWEREFALPADHIKGALLISGMYDLKPVRLSARNKYVNFDEATEHTLSTQRHLARLNTPVIVAYGSLESPEFQRQSREFAAALQAAGKPVQLIVGEGLNHFEMQETLGNPFGLAGQAALGQMELTILRQPNPRLFIPRWKICKIVRKDLVTSKTVGSRLRRMPLPRRTPCP